MKIKHVRPKGKRIIREKQIDKLDDGELEERELKRVALLALIAVAFLWSWRLCNPSKLPSASPANRIRYAHCCCI